MILLGLGSNQPFCGRPPQDVITTAIGVLQRQFDMGRVSSLFASPAWPNAADPPFVNAAVSLRRAPQPEALLAALHAIEAAFARRRGERNAPRTLDLDLLAYGDLVRDAAPTLPHPGLETRGFVLAPLAEIAPDFRSPRSGRTARALLEALGDCGVRRLPD